MIDTQCRNANLSDLAALLNQQQAAKLDVVASATQIRSRDGVLHVEGTEPELGDTGVTMTAGAYRPTGLCDESISERLGIGVTYLRRMRAERPDLYDSNINGWLHGKRRRTVADGEQIVYPADSRRFLLRLFRNDELGGEGIARVMLSDRFRFIDHLDTLTSGLEGVKEAGLTVGTDGVQITCNLSERRMRVRIAVPSLAVLAPDLFRGYRSPFADPEVDRRRNHGWTLDQARVAARREGLATAEPVVFAGLEISNSETGDGRYKLTPFITCRICDNGLLITRDAMTEVHVGSKLDGGRVHYADDTQQAAATLVRKQTRDAVKTFLNVDYVRKIIADVEQKATAPIGDAARTVEVVAKRLQYTKDETAGILDHFIRGGQMTTGGVLNAVTSYAQTVANPDRANDLEASALKALDEALAVRA